MFTLTFLAILVVLLVIVLMQLFKKSPPPSGAQPAPDLANLKVKDARAGDSFSIAGAGDDLSDLDFTSDRLTRFDAGTHRWFEVSGPYRERRAILRVAGDEDAETSLHNEARVITLDDLGLSEDDLAQIDERQNPADNFGFDDKTWTYRRSREARSWNDSQGQASPFYYWEFHEQDGKGLITIRKPEGEPFVVTRYTDIPAGDVTIYRGTL
jgi:hypothetical protein